MDRSLYKRPPKPTSIAVRAREGRFSLVTPATPKVLEVHSTTECHVTPMPIAQRMVEHLDLRPGLEVCDPQCGTGNLLDAVKATGLSISITGIEKSYELSKACRERFHHQDVALLHSCFLDHAGTSNACYHRIITNPPFKAVRAHMAAALSVLDDHIGVMVALVPITYEHPDAELLEVLSRGDFQNSQVLTKLIRFAKGSSRHAD